MKGKRNLKDEIIGKRRFELFMRDPLRKDAASAFRRVFAPNLSEAEQIERRFQCTDLFNQIKIKWNCSLSRIGGTGKNIASGNKKIFDYGKARKKVPSKYWFNEFADPNEVEPDPDTIAKSDACIIFSSQAITVKEYDYEPKKLRLAIRQHNDLMNPYTYRKLEDSGYIFYHGYGGYDDKGQYYIAAPKEHIVLGIDIGGLTEKDKTKVTEEIWNILKTEIKKRREEGQGRLPALGDPKELGFIATIEDDVFNKYLKWYDLHMGNDYHTPKGLPFRTIAYHEYLERKHPDKAEEAKRKIETERKGIIGQSIQGEDNIEKGVKLIYQAIHRKEYPSKKRLGLYKCPVHGKDCPKNCSYLKDYMKDFNKKKMLYKSLNTLAPEDLEQVVDDYRNPKKTKQRKSD